MFNPIKAVFSGPFGRPGRRLLLALAISPFLGLAFMGIAQTPEPTDKPCGDYATQSAMNECAALEAQKADVKLNETYKKLLQIVKNNKVATTKLVAAEKAWMAFRDAELAADWPMAVGENPNLLYGSVHPFCYYSELTAMTLARIETLKSRLQGEEGDVCSTAVASLPHHGKTLRGCNAGKVAPPISQGG